MLEFESFVERNAWIKEQREKQVSVKTIAGQCGLSLQRVYGIIKKDYQQGEYSRAGYRNPEKVARNQKIYEEYYYDGMTGPELSEKYGLALNYIYIIVHRVRDQEHT